MTGRLVARHEPLAKKPGSKSFLLPDLSTTKTITLTYVDMRTGINTADVCLSKVKIIENASDAPVSPTSADLTTYDVVISAEEGRPLST